MTTVVLLLFPIIIYSFFYCFLYPILSFVELICMYVCIYSVLFIQAEEIERLKAQLAQVTADYEAQRARNSVLETELANKSST